MNDILEKVMNFINENTMTLIIICIFLILVLIGYLIDNSIKTRKLEKEEKLKNKEKELEEKSNIEISVEPEVEPSINNPIEEVKDEEESIEVKQINPEVTPVIEEKVIEEIKEEKKVDESDKMEELLNKDFSNNNIDVDDIDITPDVDLDTVINGKDKKEKVEPVIEEVKAIEKEEPKSIYKSNKNLSDIFGKKPQTSNTEETNKKLETTQDYSDELDRILSKISDEENDYSKDSTLDETQDFSNRF